MNDSLRVFLRVTHSLVVVALIVGILFLDSTYYPFDRMGDGTKLIYFLGVLGYAATGGLWIDDLLKKT